MAGALRNTAPTPSPFCLLYLTVRTAMMAGQCLLKLWDQTDPRWLTYRGPGPGTPGFWEPESSWYESQSDQGSNTFQGLCLEVGRCSW